MIDHFNIRNPYRLFDFDESGFPIRWMTLGERAESNKVKNSRDNTRETKLKRTFDYVIVMRVA